MSSKGSKIVNDIPVFATFDKCLMEFPSQLFGECFTQAHFLENVILVSALNVGLDQDIVGSSIPDNHDPGIGPDFELSVRGSVIHVDPKRSSDDHALVVADTADPELTLHYDLDVVKSPVDSGDPVPQGGAGHQRNHQ